MSKKRSWIIKLKCEVYKEVVTSECTEDEARDKPWDYAIDERELDQQDYEVISVTPNE